MNKTENIINEVNIITTELCDYLPLTLRQIYYQLVSKMIIENKRSQYNMLSQRLSNARIKGLIEWSVIEDRARTFKVNKGFDDKNHFISYELRNFLKGYSRDLLQSQKKYIEIWIEKDALLSIFDKVCSKYGINIVVCKGFPSNTFINNFKERCNNQDKKPVILYFGDFDPSGLEITNNLKDKLKENFNLDIEVKRIALTLNDIQKYNLPYSFEAIKDSDTRTKKFVEKYGKIAVELDALKPDILIDIIDKSIKNEIDVNLLDQEYQLYENEIQEIKSYRKEIYNYFAINE